MVGWRSKDDSLDSLIVDPGPVCAPKIFEHEPPVVPGQASMHAGYPFDFIGNTNATRARPADRGRLPILERVLFSETLRELRCVDRAAGALRVRYWLFNRSNRLSYLYKPRPHTARAVDEPGCQVQADACTSQGERHPTLARKFQLRDWSTTLYEQVSIATIDHVQRRAPHNYFGVNRKNVWSADSDLAGLGGADPNRLVHFGESPGLGHATQVGHLHQ